MRNKGRFSLVLLVSIIAMIIFIGYCNFGISSDEVYKSNLDMNISKYQTGKGYINSKQVIPGVFDRPNNEFTTAAPKDENNSITEEETAEDLIKPGVIDPVPETTDVVEMAIAIASRKDIPYIRGGMDMTGFDCSGFVWYVFYHCGYPVKRTTAQNCRKWGPVVASGSFTWDQIQPGDLVFHPGHVAIYVGNGIVAEAANEDDDMDCELSEASRWELAIRVPRPQ